MSDGELLLLRLVPVVGVLALVGVAVIGLRRYRADRDRRLGLFAFATQQGWDYRGLDDTGLATRWRLRPFGIGDDRRAAQVVEGVSGGRTFVAFDYAYTADLPRTDGTPEKVTVRYRVTVVPLPGWLPALEISREDALSRVRSALVDDIDLESDAFNRRFRVRCADRKVATDVLNPRTMEALMRIDPPGSIRVDGADLLAAERGRHTPATVRRDLAALNALVDGIPGFVWGPRR